MQHQLIELPYQENGLEPLMSAETLQYHHGKHHAGYVNKLNSLIKGTPYEMMGLEDIIRKADGPIFNNAAQVFNHDYFFKGMTKEETTPSAELAALIDETFGSMEAFKEQFIEKAAGLFGSGWVWLTMDQEKKLHINKMCNANTALRFGLYPLMTCDVWEHAYYIDHRNGRPKYLEAWWQLINWRFVSENLAEYMHAGGQKYLQECAQSSMVCDYLDELQNNERIGS